MVITDPPNQEFAVLQMISNFRSLFFLSNPIIFRVLPMTFDTLPCQIPLSLSVNPLHVWPQLDYCWNVCIHVIFAVCPQSVSLLWKDRVSISVMHISWTPHIVACFAHYPLQTDTSTKHYCNTHCGQEMCQYLNSSPVFPLHSPNTPHHPQFVFL